MDSSASKVRMPGMPAANPRVNFYIDGYNFYVPLSTMEERFYELSWCNFLRLAEDILKNLAAEHPSDFGGCSIGAVKYFTATIPEGMPKNSEGLERKYRWLDALNHHTEGRVEVIHGTFRVRKHRFYIERDELDNLARSGIPVDWDHLAPGIPTFRPQLRIHEEKQTDVMLACALVTDAALRRVGETAKQTIQVAPNHRLNPRPTPSACHAAVVVSADIDFLPAAEMAASIFSCPVAMGFAFPHNGYKVMDFATARSKHVFTIEITEDDLRRNMLPSETVLADGRRIEFRKIKSSHFAGARASAS